MTAVDDHYGQSDLIERLNRQLEIAGIEPQDVEPRHLAGVDEFHLGGAAATTALLDDLSLSENARVLDVGCGIGGVARRIAADTERHVTGVDLTPDFVALAEHLSALTGLSDQTTFVVGDATALDVAADSFDVVTMLHVGMNVADKAGLARELARVVRPGGVIAIYDIMRVGPGQIDHPVPWSSHPATSFVAPPEDYVSALERAGVHPGSPVDRTELVIAAIASAASDPPPLNLSHLMGPTWPTMFGNLRAAIAGGVVAPIQFIGRRR